MAKKRDEQTERKTAQQSVEAKVKAELRARPVLESPLSVVKMDISELRNYTNRISDFLNSPDVAAIKICECCINIE